MVQIKVYDHEENGEKGKQVDIALDGNKLDIIAELTLAMEKIIQKGFTQAERFAFIATLIQRT